MVFLVSMLESYPEMYEIPIWSKRKEENDKESTAEKKEGTVARKKESFNTMRHGCLVLTRRWRLDQREQKQRNTESRGVYAFCIAWIASSARLYTLKRMARITEGNGLRSKDPHLVLHSRACSSHKSMVQKSILNHADRTFISAIFTRIMSAVSLL